MRRRATIPQRQRFFLGCEGESEQSYGRLLQEIADQLPDVHIHLDLQVLQGGDPLAIVEEACQKVRQHARNRGPFSAQAVLLDADRRGQNPNRDSRMEALARKENLRLVWQHPCHEALPSNSSVALAVLLQHWPEYRKPMSANRLAARIGLAQIQASASVEPELRAFLSLLGLPFA
jgi:hypothetical protein